MEFKKYRNEESAMAESSIINYNLIVNLKIRNGKELTQKNKTNRTSVHQIIHTIYAIFQIHHLENIGLFRKSYLQQHSIYRGIYSR